MTKESSLGVHTESDSPRCILFAPSVNVGGGLVLLQALLSHRPDYFSCLAILDSRSRQNLTVPVGIDVVWVDPTIFDRITAEIRLRRVSRSSDVILCFNGLPPLLRNSSQVYVYLHNRLHFERSMTLIRLFRRRIRVALRLVAERWLLIAGLPSVTGFFVQTESMATCVRQLLSKRTATTPVWIAPFSAPVSRDAVVDHGAFKTEYDFVYVADEMPHKNHETLLKAWLLLADEGLFPSLLLTIDLRRPEVRCIIESHRLGAQLKITSRRNVSRKKIPELFMTSRALIYPSFLESFGLPLIEAEQLKLPIIAAELDYVRDVCIPKETFDPHSAVSIARAVKRFLFVRSPTCRVGDADQMWRRLRDVSNPYRSNGAV
jgi:glycosyltransferase involved in cell wall biosynthesis